MSVLSNPTSPAKLLAVDLDGTLLRRDKTIAAMDADAIRRCIDAGVHVAICTGRMTLGALPSARALSLRTPMICADGGVVADPVSGERLHQDPIQFDAAAAMVKALEDNHFQTCVFLYNEIHANTRFEEMLPFLRTWSPEVHMYEQLASASAWKKPADIAVVLAVGPKDEALKWGEKLGHEHAGVADVVTWHAGGSTSTRNAVMARPAGINKGSALRNLAAQLGVELHNVAAVGDWLNDLPMFSAAARSFAMGQSPEALRKIATDTLVATCDEGGGVAEAIDRWLG